MNLFFYFICVIVTGFVFYVTALPHSWAPVVGIVGIFIGAIHYNIVMIRKSLEDQKE